MKVIGRVDRSEDEGYRGGFIVQLTEREAEVLSVLQQAVDGHGWDPYKLMVRYGIPSDREMSGIFRLIHEWAIVKFAINDMRRVVDDLDKILMTLDEQQ